ncbi:MAG TPA: efflux RND transporter permease subunit [Xanthobacteraceae bacterium]|jgi:hydrophobe/amphiphile efflux-1 (HAE1) family protein|nr:efflux RND transporter permease subunit [Xanthobacteraceae bacterium]
MNLSEPFIRRPVATSLITAALALVGIVAFPYLPVAPLPQVDFPTISVTGTLAGASAETMASSVAAPLERQFGQIPGVTQLTSTSALGATNVVIQFDLNRNIDAAAQDVQAAITAASKFLPQAMTYPPIYRKVNPADAPIMMLWAHSDTLPLTTVHDYLDNIFIQALSQISGVAQASIIGDQKPSIRIQINPAKLASIGLTLEEIRNSLVKATTNAAKGTIYTSKVGYTIQTNDQITDAGPFNDVILAYHDGAALRVRDVGQAVIEATSRYVAGYPNNKPGILLSIKKLPGANTIETVERIKEQLPKLTANIPAAMKVETMLDRTTTIRASVHDVEFTLVLTIFLVVMVVLLFLRDFWATFIPSFTVPLALLGSFAAMFVLGFSLDNISLMGLTIAVGFVVDDAIVEVENMYRHVENGASPFDAALVGSGEIRFTVLSISLSLIAVFIPLLLMSGVIGRVFREFALTVTAAIVVSAFVSLTLAPMLCSRFMRLQTKQHGRLYGIIEAGFDAMLAGYRRTLDIVLRHQAVVLCVFFATVALTVYLAIDAPKGFFPIQDTGLISGVSQASQEVSPQEMMRLQQELGAIILRDPDVEAMGSQTGSTDSPNPANTGSFTIVLKPRDQRRATARQVIDRLRPQFAQVPGANVFLTATQDINVGARIGRGSYQYTLQDANVDELVEWSQNMLAKMRTLPQLADATSDLLANAPQLKITINRDQASRFGISPQLIDDTLNDAYGQRQITQFYTQLNTYFVILEILPDLQANPASLDQLYVKSPLTGGVVPLANLVEIDSSKAGPLQVTHQSQFPAVTLTFNLRPGVALGEAVDAVTAAAAELGMPPQISYSFQGDAQAFQASLSNMPVLILASLVVVYIILGILYESFIHPLTILSTLPSAGVGALLALRYGQMELGVIGIVGLILLIGIVKKNGIILVDFAISAERERKLPPVAAIREACLLRFRPIMMTTAAAMLAGVPLALGNGTGSEMRQPLGYAMVGGLALSQLLTLYTTPVIFLYLDRLQNWLKGDRARGDDETGVRAVAAE